MRKIVSISITPQMEAEITRLLREEHRTKSELFREALRQYILTKRWLKILK